MRGHRRKASAAGGAGRPERNWLLSLWAVAALATATAGGELYPGIIGEDDRVRVEQRGAPWDAIGQVNIGGYSRVGQCTGTLVAPDIVLTAAHCVVDPWKAAPLPLHDIHFLAGLRGGNYLAHATAKCLHFFPGYQPPEKALSATAAETASFRQLGTDVVAIVLKDKLDVAPVPIAKPGDVAPGLSLIHAAYPADRRYVLSAHFGCRLLGVEHDPQLWLNDCDTHPASSGGPVLTEAGGGLKLAAVMVAAGNGAPNVAVPIAGQVELTRDGTCPSSQ